MPDMFPPSVIAYLDAVKNQSSDETLFNQQPYRDLLAAYTEPHKIALAEAALHIQLLKEVHRALNQSLPVQEDSADSGNYSTFYLVLIAGALVAACEGFDGISTLLSIFSFPAPVILFAGLLFSLLSIAIFYSFNLALITKNLGIKLSDTPKLIDLYLQELTEIKALRKTLNQYNWTVLSINELEELLQVIHLLTHCLDSITKSCRQFEDTLHSSQMENIKNTFITVAGLLFFTSGYFVGQSVALFVSGLFFSVLTPAALPVVLFGLVVGLAACAFYWYVERPELEGLLGGLFGLDEEKMNALSATKLTIEKNKLIQMKEQICGVVKLSRQIDALSKKEESVEKTIGQNTTASSAANRWSFYHQPGDQEEKNELLFGGSSQLSAFI